MVTVHHVLDTSRHIQMGSALVQFRDTLTATDNEFSWISTDGFS